MLKFVVTGLALALTFIYSAGGLRPPTTPSAGINGTFYSTKPPYHLASLVYWDGKIYGAFPAAETDCRGGIVCYKDGTVSVGYFTVKKGELYFNGQKNKWDNVKWAITGGGLFLVDGKAMTAKEVSRKEKLSLYITRHTRYSFIAVHKDRRTVTLGVSLGWGAPEKLAKLYKDKYYAILRMDGGSQTRYWTKFAPRRIHNGLAFLSN